MKKVLLLKKFYSSVILILLSITLGAQTSWNYVSPQPGSKLINPENNIALRNGARLNRNSISTGLISVTGTVSGLISGNVKLSHDSRTLIFTPKKSFQYAETINVKLLPGIQTESGANLEGISFHFVIKSNDSRALSQNFDQSDNFFENVADNSHNQLNIKEIVYSSSQLITYGNAELPDNFPPNEILAYNNPAPGVTFFGSEPATEQYGDYAVIVDNYGTPVFFREWKNIAENFQMVANNQLVHKNTIPNASDGNSFAVLNNKYEIIDTLQVGNGYKTNGHDIIMLANGYHYLMIYDEHLVGMDTVVTGGNPNATVRGFVLQELDPDHNVIFQWRSWDHFVITDANHIDLTAQSVDYVHINSFDTTSDGNLLLCCRHFDEITKIDRNTGDIIWRFGPKAQNNMFTFTNDTAGFTWPHDIRQNENGNITLYDNGNFDNPRISKGMEYELDEQNLVATLVYSYSNDPAIYGKNKGSTRRLPNNNVLVGWGNNWPIIATEANNEGTKTWELSVDSSLSFKVLKFNWQTSCFETNFDTIDYGYYDDYVSWPVIFTVTNNMDHEITITSASNHLEAYTLGTQLPLNIAAGGSENMVVYFYPMGMGIHDFNDVLTLNYDSYYADTMPQRITRQIVLKGTTIEPLNIDQNSAEQISISPNPTSGLVQIATSQKEITNVSIYNALGKIVANTKGGLNQQIQLDISGYESGVYFIQVELAGETKSIMAKVIKN